MPVYYVAALPSPGFSGSAANTGPDQAQLTQLKNGEILVAVQKADKSVKGMVVASIMIEAPPKKIWPENDLKNPAKQKNITMQSEKLSINEIGAALGVFRFFGRHLLRMHRIPDLQMSLALNALSSPVQHKNFQKHFASLYTIDDNHYLNSPGGLR